MTPRARWRFLLSRPHTKDPHNRKVIGTVSAITDKKLDVKTRAGIVSVALDEKTTFAQGKTKMHDATMLKIGDRVVVDAEGEGGLTAETVTMAAAPAPPAAKKTPGPKEPLRFWRSLCRCPSS